MENEIKQLKFEKEKWLKEKELMQRRQNVEDHLW